MTQLVAQQGPSFGEVVFEILKVTAPPVLGYIAGRADGNSTGYQAGCSARQPVIEQLAQERDQNYRAWQYSNGQLQKTIAENNSLRAREQAKMQR